MIRFFLILVKLAILGGVVTALLTSPKWIGEVDVSKVAQVMQHSVEYAVELVGKFQ